MADSVDNTVGPTQPALKKALARPDKPRLTYQQKWADSWLRRLQLAGVAMEERLKMPLDSVNRISQQIINASDAYTRTDMMMLARRKLLGAQTMENYAPITINGVLVNPPVTVQQVNGAPVAALPAAAPVTDPNAPPPAPPVNPHPPPHLQEFQRKVRQLTVQDRMLLGTALDQMLTIIRLQMQMRKAEQAASPRPASVSQSPMASHGSYELDCASLCVSSRIPFPLLAPCSLAVGVESPQLLSFPRPTHLGCAQGCPAVASRVCSGTG